MRFSSSLHWSPLYFFPFFRLPSENLIIVSSFRATTTTILMTTTTTTMMWILFSLHSYRNHFACTLNSSKLLGFICELVESSQTVQQHMIQVSNKKPARMQSNFHPDSIEWNMYVLCSVPFAESWIFSDIIYVATLFARSSHLGCAGLIFEPHQILGHVFVRKQWSAAKTGKWKCVPWIRNRTFDER